MKIWLSLAEGLTTEDTEEDKSKKKNMRSPPDSWANQMPDRFGP